MQLYVEKKDEQEYRRALREIGDFESVRRFLAIYGKPSTRRTYASLLAKYLRWLRAKGVRMNPDELVLDNLQCVYKSDPTDVATKRRHRAWLEEYVNVWMKEKGQADTSRAMVGAVVRRFYVTNDSPQFGNLSVSKGRAIAIFGHLNYLKSTGALKDWTLVIEEGHRFGTDANLRSLLIEGRKSCRKVILITTDWSNFRGIAKVFKPRPWEIEPENRVIMSGHSGERSTQ